MKRYNIQYLIMCFSAVVLLILLVVLAVETKIELKEYVDTEGRTM